MPGVVEALALTAIAHAAKRYWRYPEEWLRLWAEDLTVTPDFIDADRVCCAQRSREVVGFCAASGEGLTRELEHMWVAPEQVGGGVGPALFRA
jgi:acetyltransferase (GNAT) family protein